MKPEGTQGAREPRAKGKRSQRAPDVSWVGLERAALAYLTRFDSSVQNLRRVLTERLKRARRVAAEPIDAEAVKADIEALLARYQQSGLLDDRRYATHQLESLRRRGVSRRAAEQRLAQRGVARELLAELLAAEQGEPELEAARAYLRRRRLIPRRADPEVAASPWPEAPEEPGASDPETSQPEAWPRATEPDARKKRSPTRRRAPSATEVQRQRALAALARRGFGFDVARRALEAETSDLES
ncbi:MAG: RecX family transcriptional regulator [Polyangiaceae bacterium]|nr:RecX family transcriptional regulator [Polyangiaceae bacterium]